MTIFSFSFRVLIENEIGFIEHMRVSSLKVKVKMLFLFFCHVIIDGNNGFEVCVPLLSNGNKKMVKVHIELVPGLNIYKHTKGFLMK